MGDTAETVEATPFAPTSLQASAHDATTAQLTELLQVVQASLSLTETRYKGLADLEAQRAAAMEEREKSLAATVARVEQMVSLLQDFLAQVDTETEKLVSVAAALIRFQQEMAQATAQQARSPLR